MDARAELATKARALSLDLKKRNLILSARLLSSLDQPRDHIAFSPSVLVENLAACDKDVIPYQLNAVSFSASLQSPTVEAINKIFSSVGLKDLFERLGRSTGLQRQLRSGGVRATSIRVQERIGEIVRLRNNLAHAGDEERSVTIEEFDYLVDFFRVVAFEIDLAVKETIEQGFE